MKQWLKTTLLEFLKEELKTIIAAAIQAELVKHGVIKQ